MLCKVRSLLINRYNSYNHQFEGNEALAPQIVFVQTSDASSTAYMAQNGEMHFVIGETASRMLSTEKFGVIKDTTKENNNKS